MERILRTRLVTALILVVVFGTGAVTGAAWDRGVESHHDAPTRTTHHEFLFMQVHPTERQKVLMDSIYRVSHAAFKKLHDEIRTDIHAKYDPRFDSLIEKTRQAIKNVLTPAQVTQYDSLLARSDRKRAERAARQNRE